MAEDFYLHLSDGIEGESRDAAHSKEIQVVSWEIQVTQRDVKNTSGEPDFTDVRFTTAISKASPSLFILCCQAGKKDGVIRQATLSCRKAGGGTSGQYDYLQWRFHDCRVTSYKMNSEAENVKEEVTFYFAKCEMAYARQKEDGTMRLHHKKGWDREQNKQMDSLTLPYEPRGSR